MFSVVGCIVYEHDLWLVAIAAIICAAGSWATFQLFARARLASPSERHAWLVLTSVVAGAGIWCTHFIAMLGYNPDLPIGFDPVLTIISLLVAISGVAVGFLVAAGGNDRRTALLGGGIIGLAIAVMHYTGMQAFRVQGIVSWEMSYLVASVVLSVGFGCAALYAATRPAFRHKRLVSAGLFTLGIVALHFTGMTAFRVDPMIVDASLFVNPAALRGMALAVAGVAAIVLGAGWASTFIDTKARAEASDALNNMSNGLLMVAPDRSIRLFNQRLVEIFKLDPADISIGMSLDRYLAMIAEKVGWGTERLERISNNHTKWLSGSQTIRLDHHFDDGTVINVCCQPVNGGGAIITYDDVTEARASQAEVAHMAFHDALTGLPNRRGFRRQLETLEATSSHVLLMLDLDRFKYVNDTFGHAVGDLLLVAVAQRLRDLCNPSDTASRLGGDELGVLTSRDQTSAAVLAQEIVAGLSLPYQIGDDSVSIGCSVGVAFLGPGVEPELAQQMADFALYRAKENGRGRVEIYTEGMLEEAARRRQFERDLGKALQAGQFELHFQPLFALPDKKLAGFEALLRWRHPETGMVPPAEFIPIAEQTGSILDIGAWVFDEACRQLAQWPADIYVSINVSPVQLRSANILNQIVGAMDRHQVLPRRIEIELTETAMVDNSEQIASILSGLRAIGVRIAMDDFGTGYSSLAHLREFELDRIKIDRSFINVSVEDESAAAVVRAVTGLARDLSIATTGEGVENEDQLANLVALGCGTAQGFLLGKPLSVADVNALLRSSGITPAAQADAVSGLDTIAS